MLWQIVFSPLAIVVMSTRSLSLPKSCCFRSEKVGREGGGIRRGDQREESAVPTLEAIGPAWPLVGRESSFLVL